MHIKNGNFSSLSFHLLVSKEVSSNYWVCDRARRIIVEREFDNIWYCFSENLSPLSESFVRWWFLKVRICPHEKIPLLQGFWVIFYLISTILRKRNPTRLFRIRDLWMLFLLVWKKLKPLLQKSHLVVQWAPAREDLQLSKTVEFSLITAFVIFSVSLLNCGVPSQPMWNRHSTVWKSLYHL